MGVTVFPTGTTIYDPEKCWNCYTVLQCRQFGAALVDMNGNLVKLWKNLQGLPSANKILPGGYIMGATGQRNPKFGFQDNVDLVQLDWEGNTVWSFDKYELVRDPHRKKTWMARQHHDYQRDGNPVGYYVPGLNGIDVLEKIRERSDTPVIILSVIGDVDTISDALAAGADDYIIKPFDNRELVVRVKAQLSDFRKGQ